MRKAYAVKNLLLGNGSNSCSCKEGGYYAIGYHCLEKKGSDDRFTSSKYHAEIRGTDILSGHA
jgi:hypothetical protein